MGGRRSLRPSRRHYRHLRCRRYRRLRRYRRYRRRSPRSRSSRSRAAPPWPPRRPAGRGGALALDTEFVRERTFFPASASSRSRTAGPPTWSTPWPCARPGAFRRRPPRPGYGQGAALGERGPGGLLPRPGRRSGAALRHPDRRRPGRRRALPGLPEAGRDGPRGRAGARGRPGPTGSPARSRPPSSPTPPRTWPTSCRSTSGCAPSSSGLGRLAGSLRGLGRSPLRAHPPGRGPRSRPTCGSAAPAGSTAGSSACSRPWPPGASRRRGRRDLPRSFVLKEDLLLSLATRQPTEATGPGAPPRPRRPPGRPRRRHLARAHRGGPGAARVGAAGAGRPAAFTPAVRQLEDRLRQLVTERAAALGIPPEILVLAPQPGRSPEERPRRPRAAAAPRARRLAARGDRRGSPGCRPRRPARPAQAVSRTNRPFARRNASAAPGG